MLLPSSPVPWASEDESCQARLACALTHLAIAVQLVLLSGGGRNDGAPFPRGVCQSGHWFRERCHISHLTEPGFCLSYKDGEGHVGLEATPRGRPPSGTGCADAMWGTVTCEVDERSPEVHVPATCHAGPPGPPESFRHMCVSIGQFAVNRC